MKRLIYLEKRFKREEKFLNDYKAFFEDMLSKGYVRESKTSPENGQCWYIPHHGVYHPKKPDKIRVVFDCSAEVNGTSINKELMSGPDLTNQIVGVLLKFRQEHVAFMADIEAMFYQVRVPPEQRNFLRLLWWKDSDFRKKIIDHEMCVHLFGGTSSPSCSNYAVKRTAADNQKEFGKLAADTLRKNFYVDDLLKSVKTIKEAIELIRNVINMCAAGGFNLTKFTSNAKEVLKAIPEEKRRKGVKDQDLVNGDIPHERALGIHWKVEEDTLGFKINIKNKPSTRRGLLSMLSSVYDPLGIAGPFILEGRSIIQQLCKENLKWDQKIPKMIEEQWSKWVSRLVKLEEINVPRCYKPTNFGKIIDRSIHHFSDASEKGYGQASYLRLVDNSGKIYCSLLIGKSRVAPIKYVSIPRMELTAAALSVKVATMVKRELEIGPFREYFWTDSQAVLGYINNDVRRFKVFVANRVQLIRDHSEIQQWHYVNTADNPADYASRGIDMNQKEKVKKWFNGPSYLWKNESEWPFHENKTELNPDDPEVKKNIEVNSVQCKSYTMLEQLLKSTTDWYKIKRIMGCVLKFIQKLKGNSNKKNTSDEESISNYLSVELLQEAEIIIIRMVQSESFGKEKDILLSKGSITKSSAIYQLDPFIDDRMLILAGGRLRNSSLNFHLKHPVLLPKKHPVTDMIVHWCHRKVAHGGRGYTLNCLRSFGFWVVSGNSVCRSVIHKCVICRRLRGKLGHQKMADLPKERLIEAPPFTYCGLDMFGPFVIKERRSELKRYGIIFTCFGSRAVHIEVANNMETDSFIQALRRFVARRGNTRYIKSDNGTNFVGADNELTKAFQQMDHGKISSFLQENGSDWVTWERNPPAASHMGGVWERQIKSARSILAALINTHGRSLNDESLQTLMVEVEAVINSRPLTVDTISDVNSQIPISPTNLLTMKSKVVMPPPGNFEKADVYSKRRWRRVQHITNEFWSRWRKEFLNNLQSRSKWNIKTRSFEIGDIVLIREEHQPRNHWPMARIINTEPDKHGIVRSVEIKVGLSKSGETLRRPISKLVLLVPTEEQ